VWWNGIFKEVHTQVARLKPANSMALALSSKTTCASDSTCSTAARVIQASVTKTSPDITVCLHFVSNAEVRSANSQSSSITHLCFAGDGFLKNRRRELWKHSINHIFAHCHNISSNETARTSRRDEQDSQAPGALMAALIGHKISKNSCKTNTNEYITLIMPHQR